MGWEFNVREVDGETLRQYGVAPVRVNFIQVCNLKVLIAFGRSKFARNVNYFCMIQICQKHKF